MPILWNNCLSVSVKELDEQHQTLLQDFNVLAQGIRGGADKDTLQGLFDQLLQDARLHIQTEERYFEPLDCPSLVDHRQEHRVLLERLDWLRKLLIEERVGLTEGLICRMEDLLLGHIVGCDMRYVALDKESPAERVVMPGGAKSGSPLISPARPR